MRRGREVAEGQRYTKVGRGGGTWLVLSVRTDPMGAAHAHLQHVDEPNTFRTVATTLLLDPRHYRLVE